MSKAWNNSGKTAKKYIYCLGQGSPAHVRERPACCFSNALQRPKAAGGGTEVPGGSKGGWTNNLDCLSPSGILQNHSGRDRAERGRQTGGHNGNDCFGDVRDGSRRSNQLSVDSEKTNWNYHWIILRKQAINRKSIKDKQTHTWLGARFQEVTHHLYI